MFRGRRSRSHGDGIAQQPVLGEPPAGCGVQLTDPVGMPGGQTDTQSVGKQVVVAVPPALVVERDDDIFPRSRV